MNLNTAQTLYLFYLATILINLIVSSIQFTLSRETTQKYIMYYWIGQIITAICNSFFTEVNFYFVVFSNTGAFISQMILCIFMGKIRNISIPIKSFVSIHCLSLLISLVFYYFGFSTLWYVPIAMGGMTSSVLITTYLIYKNKTKPLPSSQNIFLAASVLMTLHYLDWAYFRLNGELFLIASMVAFGFIHTLSILMPMMASENTLQTRNDALEEEVIRRATQLTEAREQLWQSNKLASLGRMAGGIAHEINNPLSIIGLQMESLQTNAQNDRLTKDETIKVSTRVLSVIDRISKITAGLRTVARDRSTLEKKPEDLIKIINDTLIFCSDRMTKLGVLYSQNIHASEIIFFCNAVEISQVILNLLNNSIDAVESLPEKWISLTTNEDESHQYIYIEDSGTMDPKIINKIMDPFFTTKTLGKGIGLGLSISKSIIESHGGNFYLDTNNSHTRFCIKLPK